MPKRLSNYAFVLAMSALGILVIAWLGFYDVAWNDYDDEARPAIDALIQGHVLSFLTAAPAYGGSLILRAPFALVPGLWGGGPVAVYRMVSLPCLLVAAGVGIVIVGQMRGLHRSRLARGALLALFVANPITIRAGEIGHPEDLLSAGLAIAAVLVAMRGRSGWAGLLLGLAIANKEWALVAVGPVLLALPAGRVRAIAISGGVVAVVLAPLVLAGGGFTGQLRAAASVSAASPIFQPWQVWWFLGTHGHAVYGLFGAPKPGYRVGVGWAITLSHPLIVLIGAPLTFLAARGRRREYDALLLLALLLLLRAELDVWDTVYYALPFILALAAWEALTHDRPPVGALAATALSWVVFVWAPVHLSADQQSLLFLAAALPATCSLAFSLYSPGSVRRRTLTGSPVRGSLAPRAG
ncbi:MAG TPA: glycosyltransferase 87 family protein [Solirubrobacteraceae bacterium]